MDFFLFCRFNSLAETETVFILIGILIYCRDICKELVDNYFAGKLVILCTGNKFIVRRGMNAIEFVVARMYPAQSYSLVDTTKVSKINYLTGVVKYKVCNNPN